MAHGGNGPERGGAVEPLDAWERAACSANETMRAASRVEELCRRARMDGMRACGETHVQRVCADLRDAADSLGKWTQHTNSVVREALREELRPQTSAVWGFTPKDMHVDVPVSCVIVKERKGA